MKKKYYKLIKRNPKNKYICVRDSTLKYSNNYWTEIEFASNSIFETSSVNLPDVPTHIVLYHRLSDCNYLFELEHLEEITGNLVGDLYG